MINLFDIFMGIIFGVGIGWYARKATENEQLKEEKEQ